MPAETPMTQTLPPASPSLSLDSVFRLSVDDYQEMGDRGILTPDDRVELLDGYLVVKPMQNSPHATAVTRLTKWMARKTPPGWEPRSQLPVTLSVSVPEPDGVFARGDDTTYAKRHPLPAEIGLVVEVSDSTLAIDRDAKALIYARDGLPVYWIVNVVDLQVEVLTDPDTATGQYLITTIFKPGDTLSVVLDGVAVGDVAVDDLLPP
jgi:Uma2 family endonuclease